MILGVIEVFLISAEVYLFGQLAYLISAIGWFYVGMQWGDRAIMIGSAICATTVAIFLIKTPLLFSKLLDRKTYELTMGLNRFQRLINLFKGLTCHVKRSTSQ